MTRLLYIIGAPGSGKSTAMEQVVLQLGLDWQPDERVWRELWVNPLTDIQGRQVAVSLGKRRPGFAGTDALSMSASPQVLKWLANGGLPEIILGEGARLGTPRFLMAADAYTDVTLIHLRAEAGLLDARCSEKGLTDAYRKGRATASESCFEALSSVGIPAYEIRTDACAPATVAETIIHHWSQP